jgi:uncharacterized protein YoxC
MELEELKCPNCKEFFDSSNGKIPRLLTACGHSMCEACINTKLSEKDENGFCIINCPEDEEVYNHITNLDQFPKNITLIKLLNKSSETKKSIKEKLEHLSNLLVTDSNEKKDLTPPKISRIEEKQEEIYASEENINKNFGLIITPPSKNLRHVEETKINTEEPTLAIINNIGLGAIENSENNNNVNNSDNNSINYNLDPKPESLYQNLGLTPANRSSLRIGLLMKQESRLNFHNDKSGKQSTQNISQYPPNDSSIFCQLHANRALELICLDDKEKICTNCALFGNHKKHNVISEEDFVKEIEVKAEILIELFELIDNYSVTFTDKAYADQFNNLLEKNKTKCETLCKKVKDFTEELICNIKKTEQDILCRIQKIFEPINNQINATKNLPNGIIIKANEWKEQVQEKLDKLNEINDSSSSIGFTKDEIAKLIDVNITNQETISNAEEISNEFEKMKYVSTDYLDKMIEKIDIDFNYEMALKLNNLIHIINPSENEKDKQFIILDETDKKFRVERKASTEITSPNKITNIRSNKNLIPNPSNTNFSMQSIITSTSGETLGPYFPVTENESIPVSCNSGNYSFLNLSEDSGIIRLNSFNSNKMNEVNRARENPQVKPRYSNTGLTNNNLNSLASNPNMIANTNSYASYKHNSQAKNTKTGVNTNPNLNFNSNNPSSNIINIATVNNSINTIKIASSTKIEKSDKNKISPCRDDDDECSKSPTPDRDKIVFIKSQFKNEIANFTGYGII